MTLNMNKNGKRTSAEERTQKQATAAEKGAPGANTNALERGVRYLNLPRNYVIFICLKAPFPDQNLHKFSFRNICMENDGLALNDGTEKIFLSAEGTADDISDDLKHFLEYLTDQKTESSLTRRMENAVQRAKNRQDWSQEYMTLYEMREMDKEAGRKEGRKEEQKKLILNMLKNGKSPEEIAQMCDLDLEFVRNIDSDRHASN